MNNSNHQRQVINTVLALLLYFQQLAREENYYLNSIFSLICNQNMQKVYDPTKRITVMKKK